MKRILSALLLLMLITLIPPTVYADEILFRGIPWYSPITEVQASFEEGVFVDCLDDIDIWLVSDLKRDYANSVDVKGSIPGWLAFSPLNWFDYHVAGHPVMALYALGCYGKDGDAVLTDIDSSRLYLAAYSFQENDFDGLYPDLQTKLTSLYGEYIETTDDTRIGSDTLIKRKSVWTGENGTSAVLSVMAYKKAMGYYDYVVAWLTYSIEGADKLLTDIASATEMPDQTDTSGL